MASQKNVRSRQYGHNEQTTKILSDDDNLITNS